MMEQEKRDKVIKELECCVSLNPNGPKCANCDYADEFHNGDCETYLLRDALALLKAQEPRLVTESDFDGADEYGYIPVWTEEKDGDMYWECIPKVAITDPDGIEVLRYWTSRPDQATREATPWE